MADGELGKITLEVDGKLHRVASVNVYNAVNFLLGKLPIPEELIVGENLRPFYGDIDLNSEKIAALHNFAQQHAREIVGALADLFPEKAKSTIIME